MFSYGPVQSCHTVSVKDSPVENGIGLSTSRHGSKCPISNCVEILVSSAAQGMMFWGFAVSYSGW